VLQRYNFDVTNYQVIQLLRLSNSGHLTGG
jgi:hypothetical protein